eukprot:gb/GECH01003403.1/.p1 GENE.gb/GECH01003403.1/~~gb/GECH01003403.1/.p1  ORF type:complete len:357 (+),score=88.03 gb/GECH01003403.1/:1-1071(+)
MALVHHKEERSLTQTQEQKSSALVENKEPERTSHLASPIMLLTGHQGEVNTLKFHPEGRVLASGGFDKAVFLWNVYGDCENYAVLSGHANAVLEVQWSRDGERLVSASADRTLCLWDGMTGQRQRRLRGHSEVVNGTDMNRRGEERVLSVSDDGTARIWDPRVKDAVQQMDTGLPLLCGRWIDGERIAVAGIDPAVQIYDTRRISSFTNTANTATTKEELTGHGDTVTGMDINGDGTSLLTHSMDHTVSIWDVRPYVRSKSSSSSSRQVKTLHGAQHGVERNLLRCAWSGDGSRAGAGSADSPTHVYIWDTTTGELLYRLPGHTAAVNEVAFHPKEPIIGSAGSDKKIYIGEIDAS